MFRVRHRPYLTAPARAAANAPEPSRAGVSRVALGLVTLALAFAGSACGVVRPAVPMMPAPKLQSASLQQLVSSFNQDADAVHTLQLKLNLSARAGKHKYTTVTSYLLVEKPAKIRLFGMFPLVGRVFDMASNGTTFELNMPTSNEFFEGENKVIPAVTRNPLEKLRPQVILNSLLINPIPKQDVVALDPAAAPDEYRVLVMGPNEGGTSRVERTITFSRVDLLPSAQAIFDGNPAHATLATYKNYLTVDGVPVPRDMTIERPAESYSLQLKTVKNGITLNKPFTAPNTFQIKPPPGSTIHKISATEPTGAPAGALSDVLPAEHVPNG